MKIFSVEEAEGQLQQLFTDALRGETIVIRDGDKCVTLIPEEPELEGDTSNPIPGSQP